MSKTSAQIDIELMLYKCCLADKAIEYIQKEVYGVQDLDCKLNKLILLQLLIKYLSCHEAILEWETLTQQQLEETLEKANELCGCATCMDSIDLISDTLPAGLQDSLN